MKFLVTFCFIVAFGSVLGDYVEVFRKNVVRGPSDVGAVSVNYAGGAKIIDINVNDHIKNRRGAEPILVAGGPGQTYAKIRLEARGHGINSTVVIYGQTLAK